MRIQIDLVKRVMRIGENGPDLLFGTNDRFFYLGIIALVAIKMKLRKENNESHLFISINDFLNDAVRISAIKPRSFKTEKSLKENIYQCWRNRLDPDSTQCPYELIWNGRDSAVEIKILKKLFLTTSQKGPEIAEYSINIDPSKITVIHEKAADKTIVSKVLNDFLENGHTDIQKAAVLIKKLDEITKIGFYNNLLRTSAKAIALSMQNDGIYESFCGGKLKSPFGKLADIYCQNLGFSQVPGTNLIMSWFEDLDTDPWWQITLSGGMSHTYIPGKPVEIAQCYINSGDVASLFWLFHWASLAGTVAFHRNEFLTNLYTESETIKQIVYREWYNMIYGKTEKVVIDFITRNLLQAFKDLQKKG
jgi:hypothetical protein